MLKNWRGWAAALLLMALGLQLGISPLLGQEDTELDLRGIIFLWAPRMP